MIRTFYKQSNLIMSLFAGLSLRTLQESVKRDLHNAAGTKLIHTPNRQNEL